MEDQPRLTHREELAEAGVVQLANVSRNYDRFHVPVTDHLPKGFQAPQDLQVPSLKEADALIDAWLTGLSF